MPDLCFFEGHSLFSWHLFMVYKAFIFKENDHMSEISKANLCRHFQLFSSILWSVGLFVRGERTDGRTLVDASKKFKCDDVFLLATPALLSFSLKRRKLTSWSAFYDRDKTHLAHLAHLHSIRHSSPIFTLSDLSLQHSSKMKKTMKGGVGGGSGSCCV